MIFGSHVWNSSVLFVVVDEIPLATLVFVLDHLKAKVFGCNKFCVLVEALLICPAVVWTIQRSGTHCDRPFPHCWVCSCSLRHSLWKNFAHTIALFHVVLFWHPNEEFISVKVSESEARFPANRSEVIEKGFLLRHGKIKLLRVWADIINVSTDQDTRTWLGSLPRSDTFDVRTRETNVSRIREHCDWKVI